MHSSPFSAFAAVEALGLYDSPRVSHTVNTGIMIYYPKKERPQIPWQLQAGIVVMMPILRDLICQKMPRTYSSIEYDFIYQK